MDPLGCQTYPPRDALGGRRFFVEFTLKDAEEGCFARSDHGVDGFAFGDVL
jgi:hypothetical protein